MKGALKMQTGIVKQTGDLATAVEAPATSIGDRLGALLAQCDADAGMSVEDSAWLNMQPVGSEWV